jgi:hypothetical protein
VSGDYRHAEYNGLRVAWQAGLVGGGRSFGQDYVPLVSHLFGRVGRLFEFCAGPGFIGFSLLAHGRCDHLVLADVNPRAIDAINETIRLNDLGGRVSVYESDGLDGIPRSERWDLVVGNPPHFLAQVGGAPSLLVADPGWRLHRAFYAGVRDFLAPGGSVLMQENSQGSALEDFLPTITDSGLVHVRTLWYSEGRGGWPWIYYLWIKKAMPGMVFDDGPVLATLALRDPVAGRAEAPARGPLILHLVNETGRAVVPQLVAGDAGSMLWLPLDEMSAGTDLELPPLGLKPGEYEVRDAAQAVPVARLVIG